MLLGEYALVHLACALDAGGSDPGPVWRDLGVEQSVGIVAQLTGRTGLPVHGKELHAASRTHGAVDERSAVWSPVHSSIGQALKVRL